MTQGLFEWILFACCIRRTDISSREGLAVSAELHGILDHFLKLRKREVCIQPLLILIPDIEEALRLVPKMLLVSTQSVSSEVLSTWIAFKHQS